MELKINYLTTHTELIKENGLRVSRGVHNHTGEILKVIAIKGSYGRNYEALVCKKELSKLELDYFQKKADSHTGTYEWFQPWAFFNKCENNSVKLPVLNRGEIYIVATGKVESLYDYKRYEFVPRKLK